MHEVFRKDNLLKILVRHMLSRSAGFHNARSSACAVTGVTCAAPPTRPFPRPGRGRQEVGHSPVGSDISWTLGSSGTTIGSALSYEQPMWILAYWAAPSLPDDVGARIGSQRVQTPQTQRDVAGIFSQVKGSPLDSVRR